MHPELKDKILTHNIHKGFPSQSFKHKVPFLLESASADRVRKAIIEAVGDSTIMRQGDMAGKEATGVKPWYDVQITQFLFDRVKGDEAWTNSAVGFFQTELKTHTHTCGGILRNPQCGGQMLWKNCRQAKK